MRVQFSVKGGVSGLFIAAEALDRPLSILKNGLLGFELPRGTSPDQAEEIARFLNAKLSIMSFTKASA